MAALRGVSTPWSVFRCIIVSISTTYISQEYIISKNYILDISTVYLTREAAGKDVREGAIITALPT